MKNIAALAFIFTLVFPTLASQPPSITWEGLEHDNKQSGKPSTLNFSGDEGSFVLQDPDGFPTLATLYAATMLDVRNRMRGEGPYETKQNWEDVGCLEVEDKIDLRSILIHSCNRFLTVHGNKKDMHLGMLRSFQSRLKQKPFLLSYSDMYSQLGAWMRRVYSKLPEYKVITILGEVVDISVYKLAPFHKRGSKKELNPVGNAIKYLCTMKMFEKAYPADNSRVQFSTGDISTILKVYHQRRKVEQDLATDYVTVRTFHGQLSGGAIIESVIHYPKVNVKVEK